MSQTDLAQTIRLNIRNSLDEDLGVLTPALSQKEKGGGSRDAATSDADLTAQLLPETRTARAQVITRQSGVLCGTAWFDGCFLALDPDCKITWQVKDGDRIKPGQTLCQIAGRARALLTAERSALNLLQTLSATATLTRRYVDAVAGLPTKIMDTRKTLPGLRHAQKYAVVAGGGHNQRAGLYDGILIKENHIAAAGGIAAVMAQAFNLANPGVTVQIEVENMLQLDEALNAGAKLILLDNFDIEALRIAVKHTAGRAELEASGGITLTSLREIAETGVDRISIGALTKDVEALDLSMRIL